MPKIMIEKTELLGRIQTAYNQLETLLAGLDEHQMTTPNVNGSWSVKDNIAHLTVWQDYLRTQLTGVLAGEKPAQFLPELPTEDEENEHIYQANKDRPLAEVMNEFRASYQRVLETVQAMSNENLNGPFPWGKDDVQVWPLIVGNTYGHYEEHSATIQDWLKRG